MQECQNEKQKAPMSQISHQYNCRQDHVLECSLTSEVATVYKNEGHMHNSKQEQLVTSALIAAQLSPDTDVRLPSHGSVNTGGQQSNFSSQYAIHVSKEACSCTCPQGQLQYPCKHVMKLLV